MEKHLIDLIGGSGFIGTRLAHRLTSKPRFSVRILDKNRSSDFSSLWSKADVRSRDELLSQIREGATIVNLAAEHKDDVRPRTLYDQVNVQGARNICEVASEKNSNMIVFTSTVAVYGFAQIGTNEDGVIAPFNDYGRTKHEAEQVFRMWQAECPEARRLVILRPTVVFGERNRGNVYNLVRQIASGKFIMIGSGNNRKSMVYVENVAAFIEHTLEDMQPGVHVFNVVDKPDLNMNELVRTVKKGLGRPAVIGPRLPVSAGLLVGMAFDIAARATGRSFAISSIRIRKFCADSVYASRMGETGFVPPIPLPDALSRTVSFEFLEKKSDQTLFYSE